MTGAAVLSLTPAAHAADAYALPQGCTAYVTVQKRGCEVSHLFRCEGDPEGYQHRVDLSDAGMIYLGIIDAETQWIESYYPGSGETNRLLPGAADPASLTELLATGRDDWDFRTDSNSFSPSRTTGYDEIVGGPVVIDGVTLSQTHFKGRAVDEATGAEIWSGDGQEYVNPEWRTFLSGRRTTTSSSGTFESDHSPVEFAFPGEDGFLATKPKFDCGVVMSKQGGGQ